METVLKSNTVSKEKQKIKKQSKEKLEADEQSRRFSLITLVEYPCNYELF